MINSWGKALVWAVTVSIAVFFFVACGDDTKTGSKDTDTAVNDTSTSSDSSDDPGTDAVVDVGNDTDTGASDDDALSTEPPVPFIALRYNNQIGGLKDYRVIKDPVNMDVSLTCPRKEGADEAACSKIISDTVVSEDTITLSDFNNTCCAENWQERYCIKYRWELIETPTPLSPETRITLDNLLDGGEGTWYRNCGDGDPTLASFTGFMITPTPDNKRYKVQIQAITIDKETQFESDIAEKVDTPNIIPVARVMAQLTWKEGLLTRAEMDRQGGGAGGLDLHLIKKKGMDACGAEVGADGLLCTSMGRPGLPGIETPTHDDCHFNDLGNNGIYPWTGCESDFKTIAWYGALDIDNTWGGGTYTNPETIDLGPIDDEDRNGQPDVNPFTDDYLIVVNYNRCQNLQEEGSNADCEQGGADYNVHARVDIFVDGVLAPRAGKDDATLSRSEFVIRPQEWIVVGLISWDQALATGLWSGDAVVKNTPATHQKACLFDLSYCYNTPIWDWVAFETWVVSDPNANGGGGLCYEYGTRQ